MSEAAQTTPDIDKLEGWLVRLYDGYRTARYNQKYNAYRLVQSQRKNRAVEITIIVGTSSTVAAWAVWATTAGTAAWGLISAAAALISIIKPFLNYPNDIERYSKNHTAYHDIFLELQSVVNDVQVGRNFTDEMAQTIRQLEKRFRTIAPGEDPVPNQKLRARCYKEVLAEIPASNLWMPRRENDDTQKESVHKPGS